MCDSLVTWGVNGWQVRVRKKFKQEQGPLDFVGFNQVQPPFNLEVEWKFDVKPLVSLSRSFSFQISVELFASRSLCHATCQDVDPQKNHDGELQYMCCSDTDSLDNSLVQPQVIDVLVRYLHPGPAPKENYGHAIEQFSNARDPDHDY
ncbi:hypothetical protein DFH06DRAFT_1144735 [Mycena polygramma]|nr:hypothetical protein DFH06DRAFT_1144735 [Mycena polygramma]